MSAESAIANVRGTAAQFRTVWNAEVRPKLPQFNGQVPAQFVIDVVKALGDNIADPFVDAENKMLERITMSSVGGFVFGLIGAVGASTQSKIALAKNLTENAASVLRPLFANTLRPFEAFCKDQVAKLGRRAMVSIDPIVTPQFQTFTSFDVLVGEALDAGAQAIEQLAQAEQLAGTTLLFRIADLCSSAADSVKRALSALLAFIADLGRSLYNAFGTLMLLLKVGLVAGAGYVGYTVYNDQKAKKNPVRRRRRYRRLSA